MLTRPLTVDSDPRGRGLVAGTVPPALPLADEGDDDERHTGVFSHPAPPWSSSSSSSCPPPPPCASSSSSASSVTPSLSFLSSPSLTLPLPTLPPLCPPPLSSPPPVSLLSPLASVSPPPPPVSPSLHSSAPSTHPSPVVFTSYTPPPPSSLFSSLSSSSNMSSSLPPPPPAPHCVSSTQYFSPSPPFPSSSSTPSISIIPDLSSVLPLPSSNFHPSPPSLSLHSGRTPPSLASSSISCSPLPPTSPCDSPPFSCASASFSSLLYHHSSFVSPPPPTPPFFTPCIPYSSALSSPLPSSSPPVHPSHLSPPLPPPTAPLFPPAPPPCCPCTTLLPRLLSAHRLEMRRLLRGALASLGHRLDSLERRCRRKMRKKRSRPKGEEEGAACSPGLAVFPLNSASSCSPAHLPPVTFSSSSDSEDTPAPQESSSLSQSQQKRTSREEGEGEGRRRKRKRKNYREREMSVSPENRKEEEEVDSGRFVGRMVVSFRGGAEQEEAPLTLHNFNNRKQRKREGGGTNQSEKAVSVVRQNGYRVPLLRHSPSSSSSQNALHFLQSAQSGQSCSQSKALSLSSGQWHFSGFTTPLTLSSNHSAFHLWLCSSSILFSPAPMLRLSAVTVETISESVIGGVSESPLRPLKDWTAPPSLSSDHCYMRTPTPSPTYFARRQQKQRASHNSRRLHLPRRLPLPLPLCSANGVSAQLPMSQSAAASEFLSTNRERCKRVSQIRIRRASPRETPLTPMGLPKVKRLKKKEFSLEEIYTNKNYKSPTTNRSLETIFEEPREKDGALLLIGQQRRRRILLFPDFTQPRKRKKLQGVGLPVAMVPRKRTAARRHCHGGGTDDDESDLDVMLVKRLSALEDFLTRQGLDM